MMQPKVRAEARILDADAPEARILLSMLHAIDSMMDVDEGGMFLSALAQVLARRLEDQNDVDLYCKAVAMGSALFRRDILALEDEAGRATKQ